MKPCQCCSGTDRNQSDGKKDDSKCQIVHAALRVAKRFRFFKVTAAQEDTCILQSKYPTISNREEPFRLNGNTLSGSSPCRERRTGIESTTPLKPKEGLNGPPCLLLADAGVEGGVDEVGEEVYGYVGESDAEEAALDEGVVAIADGGDGEATETGPGKDGFGYDGSGEEGSELEAQDGDDG